MPSLQDIRSTALSLRSSGFNAVTRININDATTNTRAKQLSFQGVVTGTSAYSVLVRFNGVSYSEAPDKEHDLSIDKGHGVYLYAARPSFSRSDVQVRCQCKDFYFTWQYYDRQVKALAGPPFPKYVRKTDNYPERNPLHVPGYCKHIEGMVRRLLEKKFIVP